METKEPGTIMAVHETPVDNPETLMEQAKQLKAKSKNLKTKAEQLKEQAKQSTQLKLQMKQLREQLKLCEEQLLYFKHLKNQSVQLEEESNQLKKQSAQLKQHSKQLKKQLKKQSKCDSLEPIKEKRYSVYWPIKEVVMTVEDCPPNCLLQPGYKQLDITKFPTIYVQANNTERAKLKALTALINLKVDKYKRKVTIMDKAFGLMDEITPEILEIENPTETTDYMVVFD